MNNTCICHSPLLKTHTPRYPTAHEKQLEALRKAVELAYKNRILVDYNSLLKNDDLEPFVKDDKSGVWVDDPHMYIYLLRFGYQKLGVRGKKLEQEIKDSFEHETGHLIPIIGSPNIRWRLGIRFYKATIFHLVTISALQAEIEYKGKLTVSEDIDVTTNVSHLSPEDKIDLKKALERARKFSQSEDKFQRS